MQVKWHELNCDLVCEVCCELNCDLVCEVCCELNCDLVCEVCCEVARVLAEQLHAMLLLCIGCCS
jgi:hypothetical protein